MPVSKREDAANGGFALVVTLSLMVLLTLKIRKGRSEIMIRFDNEGSSKTTRFHILFNYITTQWNPLVEQLQKKVAQDFTSPLDVYQQRVDFDARIWLNSWSATDEQAASKELALRYYPFQPVFDVGFRVVRLTAQNPQT